MPERSRRLLVVDDNPATRYATGRVLRAAGFEISEAATGAEALDAVRSRPPALVVLDINLPDINGFDVCRAIRAIPGAEALPVVYLSATYINEAHRVYGLDAGADGYLTHPVEPAVLIATARALLRTRVAEANVRRSEARFKAVFDQALNGIALLSGDLTIREANPALATMLGLPAEGLHGRSAAQWMGLDTIDGAGTIGHALAGGSAWRAIVPFDRGDGRQVQLEWQVSALAEPGVLLASVSDVTAQQQIVREREQALDLESAARAEAERASRMKDEFLATLSHELRTPLSAVLGWAQILRRSPGDAERLATGIEIIERNARHQTRLISDLLDVSRIISGKLDVERQVVDLGAVVVSALDGERPAAAARGVALEVTLTPGANRVRGDAGRLQQVVSNLVGNAVKFTPAGGEVRVGLARRDGAVVLDVEDTGIGIEPDFLPHLFERFRQQDPTARRSHGGLGLGLAIVKHLVDLHGGSVVASSPGVGRGSRFSVRLPEVRDGAPPPGDPPHPVDADPELPPLVLSGLRVLVVEDEPDTRRLIRDVLTGWGAEVLEAADAATARALAGEHAPDLLVSDIGMPLEDGYELVRSLRAAGLGADRLPAIALTAFARGEDRQNALAAGYQVHLQKPVDLNALVRVAAGLVGRVRGGAAPG